MDNKDINLDKRETNLKDNAENGKTKQKIFQMKIYSLSSELPIEKKTMALKDYLNELLGDVPYVRYNKTEGQLIVNQDSETLKNEELNKIKNDGFEIDGIKINCKDITEKEKSDFWKYHGKHFETIYKNKYKNTLILKHDGDQFSNKDGFFLGYQRFKNVNALKTFFSNMLKKYEVKNIIEENDKLYLIELIKFHDSKDKFVNIKDFKVDFHPEFKETKCFFVINEDEKEHDFSFNKCIKNISSK